MGIHLVFLQGSGDVEESVGCDCSGEEQLW